MFINFTTSAKNRHVRFAFGSPILMPSRFPKAGQTVEGISIDRVPVDFEDPTIPDRLYDSLVEGVAARRRGGIFDCVVLAALMEGVDIGSHNKFGRFPLHMVTVADAEATDPNDTPTNTCLNLGIPLPQRIAYRHTVVPAHTTEAPTYLHKLGDEGPICFSGLAVAMEMYGCTVAHPTTITRTDP